MDNKKKFHYGKKYIFFILLIVLLGLSSTSFARTTLTDSEIEYMVDNIFYFRYTFYGQSSSPFSNFTGQRRPSSELTLNISEREKAITFFKQAFNNYNTINFQDNLSDFFAFMSYWKDGTYGDWHGSIYFGQANFGLNDGFPHLNIDFNTNTQANLGYYNFGINFINDSKTIVDYNIKAIDFGFGRSTRNFSFEKYRELTVTSTSMPNTRYTSVMTPYWNSNNDNISTIDTIAGLVTFLNTQSIYINYNGANFYDTPQTRLLKTKYINAEPLPTPSTEPTTTPTTEPTGGGSSAYPTPIDYTNQLNNIDSNITSQAENIINKQNSNTQSIINNQNQNTQTIVNALSGETEKITNTLTDSADDLIDNTIITSGDIESALNFEIAQDPYSNFWTTLTNNLKSALLGTKRSIDISFQGRTWTICLDEYMVLPAWLVIILTPFSTAFFTWVLVRQFKLIFDKLASGNVDSLLKENSEERYF